MITKKGIITTGLALLLSVGTAFGQTKKSSSVHSQRHQNLIATRSNTNDQVKLLENNTFIDLMDDIEPEPDIYTEGWNSKRVNPFSESQVPNKAVIDVTNYHIPVPGKVTSNYGYRAKFGRMHKGIDLGIRSNDTIYAAFDGKVRLTNYEAKGYGNYIILRHPNQLETVYGHLNKFLVKPDQVVKAGDPIALGGSTGRSTGPHLHFETRYMGYAINPSAIFDFANHTTHTDTYTFTKQTYMNPRNYAPAKDLAKAENKTESVYQAGKANETGTYTVRTGDTIASVARTNGISKTRLLQLNNLKASDALKPGQVLKVK
jgi:murein DD-endopeptidase MepM/ murein hydrolase activator NlpD